MIEFLLSLLRPYVRKCLVTKKWKDILTRIRITGLKEIKDMELKRTEGYSKSMGIQTYIGLHGTFKVLAKIWILRILCAL